MFHNILLGPFCLVVLNTKILNIPFAKYIFLKEHCYEETAMQRAIYLSGWDITEYMLPTRAEDLTKCWVAIRTLYIHNRNTQLFFLTHKNTQLFSFWGLITFVLRYDSYTTYVQSRFGCVLQSSITQRASGMFCGSDSSSTLASSRHVWRTMDV